MATLPAGVLLKKALDDIALCLIVLVAGRGGRSTCRTLRKRLACLATGYLSVGFESFPVSFFPHRDALA